MGVTVDNLDRIDRNHKGIHRYWTDLGIKPIKFVYPQEEVDKFLKRWEGFLSDKPFGKDLLRYWGRC